MRFVLLAGAALAVSACGGGGNTSANQANTLTTNDMGMNQTMPMDNGMAPMGNGMTMNNSVDANTANAMMKDLNTNDPDTNLANGM